MTLAVGDATTTVEVSNTRRWYPVATVGTPLDIINNAGTQIDDCGFGSDRGDLEPDDGRFDEPLDVQAWCGGAVLLRASDLADVGGFDERLFLDDEDVDLSLRARSGMALPVRADAIVHHVHGASSGANSSFSGTTTAIACWLARHASPGPAARAATRFASSTASYV